MEMTKTELNKKFRKTGRFYHDRSEPLQFVQNTAFEKPFDKKNIYHHR